MPHDTGLILTLTAALSFAFVGGFVATRVGFPPVVGYLMAGVALGPFTPGYTADQHIATQLAEVGIILLMFGVGMHFSPRQLGEVRTLAIVGALGQTAVATALGILLALWWGWSLGAGLVLGLSVSVASTVVLLRALLERGLLDSLAGRAAVAWLVMEDLLTVIALVTLPVVASAFMTSGPGDALGGVVFTLVTTLGKLGIFAVLMAVVGTRVLPWFLTQVADGVSRELFTLGVLAIALGIAVSASLVFGVSLALGAFAAGLVVGQSEHSHAAAADALPMRDAFAVLFFVSVGMLLDPGMVVQLVPQGLAVLAIIMFAKPLTALAITKLLGHTTGTGLTVAAGLAQIGEFSFILAELGRAQGLLPEEGYHLVLAGALCSITLNPLLFRMVRRYHGTQGTAATVTRERAGRAP